ncbi:hypothetical protein [Pectinatus frisingensis]|uniref:hypothetical protein n=1 Tax=Pectinatus frisingensis TaxID=865 RepID=UPI003D8027D0
MFTAICVLSGFIYSQHNDINKLRNDIATINKDSSKKLNKQISDNESEISSLHSKIDDLEDRISDNESAINDSVPYDEHDLDNSIMQSQIYDLQQKLDDANLEISGLRINQR